MNDEEITKIQAEIDRLEAEKERRLKLLADPKRQEIRRLWDQVLSGIEQLDDLGEDIRDEDGRAPYLVGKTFTMNHDEIVES